MSGVAAEEKVNPGGVVAHDCPGRPGLINGVAARLVMERLSRIERGGLAVRRACDEFVFGQRDTDMPGVVDIHEDGFFYRLLIGGALGEAESYIDGQ